MKEGANDFLFLLFQAESELGAGSAAAGVSFDLFLWRSASLSWKSSGGAWAAEAEIAGISDRRRARWAVSDSALFSTNLRVNHPQRETRT